MVKKLNMKLLWPLMLSGVIVTLVSISSNAQQVATQVLDDIVISRSDYNAIIKVHFKQPFLYMSHSPVKTGDAINVRVAIIERPLSTEDQLVDNESIPLADDKGTGLTEVVYEKNGRNSNYVIFYFENDVSFEVIQGSDHRSLSVVIYGLK
jgi:hypothetical protein